MRGSEWPPSRASSELAVGVAVERGAERDQLVDARRALVDEHPHGVDVAQAGAGGERVGEVEVGGVGVAAEHGGHAALRPAGRGLLELALGEHADAHAVQLGGPHRGRQPGHARPEDEQVEVGHRLRWPTRSALTRGDVVDRVRLLDVDVAVRRRALLLGGEQLGGELVDRLVGAVDVHDRAARSRSSSACSYSA